MSNLPVNAYPEPLSMPEAPRPEDLDDLLDRFDRELAHRYRPFPTDALPEDWTVEKVRTARKLHDEGQFHHTARLIRVLTTDPRVKSALSQRVDTPTGLPIKAKATSWQGGRGAGEVARSEAEAMFTPKSYAMPPTVRRRIMRDQVMAGVAFAQVIWTARPDGERWDIRLEPWPLEWAKWDASIRRYRVTTTEGDLVIEHGFGKWVVFEPHGPQSWLLGSVRDLAMPWADRSYGIRYRSQHAAAHGSPVPIGQMPEGVPTDGKEGQLFQRLIRTMLNMRVAGVRPFGSVIEYLEPKSQAWQVFDSIVKNSNEDITLALLGQDGTTTKGGVYTAPGFDGVRFDLAELDTQTFEVGAQTGAIAPWSAVNFGRVYEPTIWTVLPDPEEDARLASVSKRYPAFASAITALRDAGIEITDELVASLAREYGVPEDVAQLVKLSPAAAAPGDAKQLEITPTDMATIVTVDQALANVGLPPRGDEDGKLTIAEFKAKHATTLAESVQAEQGTDPAEPKPEPEDQGGEDDAAADSFQRPAAA